MSTKFLSMVFADKTDDEVICVAKGSPDKDKPSKTIFWNVAPEHEVFTGWAKQPHRSKQAWYFCVSTVNGTMNEKGTALRRRYVDLVRYHCLVLDDIGTKATEPPAAPAWKIETSEKNFQWGYYLEPGSDIDRYEALLEVCMAKGWGDGGAGGAYRVVRLPMSANLKPGRNKFLAQIEMVDDAVRTLDELAEDLGTTTEEWNAAIAARGKKKSGVKTGNVKAAIAADLTGVEDKFLTWLSENGQVLEDKGDWVDVKCPWADEHTDGDVIAGYSPLGRGEAAWVDRRTFNCLHDHCKNRHFRAYRDILMEEGAPFAAARDPMPVIEDRYAHVIKGEGVVDLHQRPNGGEWVYSLREFGNMYPQQVDIEGRDRPVGLKTAFLDSKTKTEVVRVGYLPTLEDEALVTVAGQLIANSYVAPQWEETAEPPTQFLEHMDYLLPDADEREIFIDWLAWKIQNPARRSYGVIMVVESGMQGIGRSWIGTAMAAALGGKVNFVDMGSLSKRQNFNDYLFECQFLVVEEARNVEKGEYFSAYETLKERVTPGESHAEERNTKYGGKRPDEMYFNGLIFSNHSDAVAIDEADRRFTVFTNPDVMRTKEEYDLLHESLRTTDEPRRIYWYLRHRDVKAFDPIYPPYTPAKDLMIRHSKSPSDEIRDLLMEDLEGDLVTLAQVKKHVARAAAMLGHGKINRDPDGTSRRIWNGLRKLRRTKNGARYVIDGVQAEVRSLRNHLKWIDEDEKRSDGGVVIEVTRNENASPNVIALPDRG